MSDDSAFAQADIPDRSEVKPERFNGNKASLVAEAIQAGAEIHAYFPNTEPGADVHISPTHSHVFTSARGGKGLIYVKDGGEEKWLFPEEILYLERHDEI
ncbi:hypothetical protein [Halosegnis longus]|uniref:hypothetical protein n=1 Tax=Halosegnis longus TaxID=2216012 RepID=UPI00129EC2A4|nr:hypothetical protein [Halosegnis longus]